MPLAHKRVAALFVYFYKQVDKTAPEVTLNYPASDNPAAPDHGSAPRVPLTARASDEQSGVAIDSFRFEYARLTGASWSPWTTIACAPGSFSAIFTAPTAGLYALRATARDGAENLGRSPVKYIRVGAPSPGPLLSRK